MSSLRLLPGGRSEEDGSRATSGASSSRAVSTSPRSSGRGGAVPFALSQRLEAGEAVVWWDAVETMAWRGPSMLAAIARVFAMVGVAVPELWSLPAGELARAAAVSPRARLRNWWAQRTNTDGAILDADRGGRGDRLRLSNVRVVRRDRGPRGILEGAAHRIRIPPTLTPDVQRHLRRQREVMLMRDEDALDDRLGWLR